MKKTNEGDKPQKQMLTVEQKQRQKKMLIFPLMFIVFGLCMWYIFSPSKSEKAKDPKGFNTTIPMPKNKELVSDKKAAYEQEKMEQTNGQRMHSLKEMASMFNQETTGSDNSNLNNGNESNLITESKSGSKSKMNPNYSRRSGGSRQPIATIQSSNNAYRQINRNLGNFFESSKDNPATEKRNQHVEAVSAKLQEAENRKTLMDAQIQLMEKSYEMAAKYIPQGQQVGGLNTTNTGTSNPNKKIKVSRVKQVVEQPVSTLPQGLSDSVRIANSKQPHNRRFNTAVGNPLNEDINTIKACINENCSLTNGQSVRLRILEPLQVGTTLIPKNSLISGDAKIQGDRLEIFIQSMEYHGMIIPVELTAYDTDGQEGIFIPGSMEINAFKEMAAGMGSKMGTSVSFTQSAGQQLLSGLGKGVIQSGSQYLSKKFQSVTVKLKAGYQVLLLSNQE
ncbi:MAG: conjugative transposon protein TraM [Paludibacter sp.]|nr:conjugative transposon protein TraM [Paludibacter sp.]